MLFGKPSTRVGSGSAGGGGSCCILPSLLGAYLQSPRALTAARRPQDSSSLAGVTLLAALVLAGCAAGVPVAGAGTGARTQLALPSQAFVKPVCPPVPAGYARCLELIRSDTLNAALPSGYSPADVQNAYDLPSASRGKGQTIAVIDSGDNPNAEWDLNQYRSTFGQSPCTTRNGCFAKLNQSGSAGNYPKADPGDGLEIDLDIEMISATCPNCRIMLVEANTPQIADLAASVDTAVAEGANVVSNSYQVLGNSVDDAYGSHYDHPGVVVLAGGGDKGYEKEGGFPSDQPSVVAVGGTTLVRAKNRRGWSESVWGGSAFGSGSGCTSDRTPKPAWQKDTRPGDCPYRTMNDVAAVADPSTGVAEYDSYGIYGPWLVAGGTSAASPLVAGVYGLAENAAKQNGAKSLYRNRHNDLYDVVGGRNGACNTNLPAAYLCTAEPSYDGPTGNGTPHGIAGF